MSKRNEVIVCGLTHIDLGWKKTREEMAEVFDNYIIKLLDLCEKYPEYTHMLEQALHFKELKDRRPDLFERVKTYIEEGRLEFVTGLASTIENNVTCGESFVRNMQIGNAFLKKNFGVRVNICAMMDTFGFPPQMPQILNEFGIEYMMADRHGCVHDADTYIVKGIDGTKMILLGRDKLAAYVNPGHFNFKFFLQYKDLEDLLAETENNKTDLQIVYPYSENEIMPSEFMPEAVRNSNGALRYGHLNEFFDKLKYKKEEFPVVSADFNPEFTGTYSLRHLLRIENRKAEYLLLEAEKINALMDGQKQEKINDIWWEMAYVQFHDVITGSQPTKVYNDCLRRIRDSQNKAMEVINDVIGKTAFSNEFSIWNGLPFERKEVVTITIPDNWSGVKAATINGTAATLYGIEDRRVQIYLKLNPMSLNYLVLTEGESPKKQESDIVRISTDYFEIDFDDKSMISSLALKNGKVLMSNVQDLLVIQKDCGNFQIEQPVGNEVGCSAGKYTRTIKKAGDINCIRFIGEIPVPDSIPVKYEITLSFHDHEDVINTHLKIDWCSEAARLRFKLNSTMESTVNEYEIPFGIAKRKPYIPRINSRGEYPAYRFVTMTEKNKYGEYGLGLINTGVAGVEVMDGSLWTTLLRAPVNEYAGMVKDETSSDHGVHEFNFSIVPYAGDWRESGIVKYAQILNSPPLIFNGHHDRIKGIEIDKENVVLSAVKKNDDGKKVIRFYETMGKSTECVIRTNAEEAWDSDMNEGCGKTRTLDNGALMVKMNPYEIKTIIIK